MGKNFLVHLLFNNSKGSPDPDGRQIDGLGGGISSLSKIALIGRAVEVRKAKVDCRRRPIRHHRRSHPPSTLLSRALTHLQRFPSTVTPRTSIVPVSIYAINTGQKLVAHVPVEVDGDVVQVAEKGNDRISGVPGTAAGVKVEFLEPVGVVKGRNGEGAGNGTVVVEREGKKIPVSVMDCGLPVIFVSIDSLSLPFSTFSLPPSTLDQNTSTMSLIESLRTATAHYLNLPLTPSTPKICLISPPTSSYTTTSNTTVAPINADVFLRAVSVGNVHRTVPATVLLAAAASACVRGTVVNGVCQRVERKGWLRVGHPAGVAEAGARVVEEEGRWRVESTVMLRTARRIMEGNVIVPQ
ncbi:PrpF protein [Chytridium lagenaria]|nr:PrpF protein [Chytridium lagenaria]